MGDTIAASLNGRDDNIHGAFIKLKNAVTRVMPTGEAVFLTPNINVTCNILRVDWNW
jgi:hypothetical protein